MLGCGPDDAVLPDPIRVSVSKLLARSRATPVFVHCPESVAPTAPKIGKESTGSADERAVIPPRKGVRSSRRSRLFDRGRFAAPSG